MELLVVVVGWIVLGLVGAGWMFADVMQIFVRSNRKFGGSLYTSEEMREHERQNMVVGAFLGAFGGPLVLVIGFAMSGWGKSGWWMWYKGRDNGAIG